MSAIEADADDLQLAPRRNTALLGHQAAELELVRAAESGRLPHAILLAGPAGIGKATLAYRFARWLLAQDRDLSPDTLLLEPKGLVDLAVPPDHPVARSIAASSHPDLFTVERGWDPKRKRVKGEIVVDDIRAAVSFLHLTSAGGGWRVVIIDGIDEMNRNAANALLKILEEPPKRALLLLVCHSVGRVLPTIRSRCRTITLQPLAESELLLLLALHRPDLAPEDREALARLAEGSIGRALELGDGGSLKLYRDLLAILASLPVLDTPAAYRFADALARGDEGTYNTVTELLLNFVSRLVIGAAEGEPREAFAGEAALLTRLAQNGHLDRWIDVWDRLRTLFARADAVNLDRKQVILDVFMQLREAAR